MTYRESFLRTSSVRTALIVGLALAVLLPACADGTSEDASRDAELVAVKRGLLRIAVREGGDLESGKPVSVRSEVEGRNAIIELVEEGTFVEKDQILCKLDSAGLEDRVQDQELTVDKAKSDVAQAVEDYAIQEKSNLEAMKQAETTKALAKRAYEAYKNGTLPLERKRLESQLTVAKEELKRAQTEHQASRRLFEKEIIPKTQVEADELGEKKASEKVTIATKDLAHFNEFTCADELQKLKSDWDVSEIAYERVKQQCASNLKQAQDIVDTATKNLGLEQEQFDKLKGQLKNCVIKSPAAGLVVYARERKRHGSDEPVSLGKEIREREQILQIPDLTNMVVQLDIHESSVKKVRRGQRAWITVDALPGQVFPGTVLRVALVPSSQSSWMNPDLKVYEADVKLEEIAEGIKPGMHAQVEILVDQLDSVLQIPLQCVAQAGSRTFVYVSKGDDIELREVEVGLNNQSYVHVKSGLEEGEFVYLSRPDDAPALPKTEGTEFMEAKEMPSERPGGPPTPGGRGRGSFDDGNIGGAPRGGGRGGRGNMSAEDRAKMMERFNNMSEEEKKAWRERMRNRGGREGGGEGRRGRGDGEGRRGRGGEGRRGGGGRPGGSGGRSPGGGN